MCACDSSFLFIQIYLHTYAHTYSTQTFEAKFSHPYPASSFTHYQRYRYRHSQCRFNRLVHQTKQRLTHTEREKMYCACKPIQLNSLSANVFTRARARQNTAFYARQPMTQQTIQFHFGHTHTPKLYIFLCRNVCMHACFSPRSSKRV